MARFERLIEQLASRNSAPTLNGGIEPVTYPPDYDRAAEAAVEVGIHQLFAEGRAAFAVLVAHGSDRRYSRTMASAQQENWTVGEVCGQLLQRQIENYNHHSKRRGPTPREIPDLQHEGKLREWWQSRAAMGLKALQLEAIDLRIRQERELADQEEQAAILDDLIHHRKEIQDSEAGLPPMEGL